jgi:hypothetical protein
VFGPHGVHPLQTSVLALPSPGVFIEVAGPNATLREEILDSVRVVAVDSNGCPAKVAPAERSGGPPAISAPTTAVVCRYYGGWLALSATATAPRIDRMVSALDGLPPAGLAPPASCIHLSTESFMVQLRDAAGRSVTSAIGPSCAAASSSSDLSSPYNAVSQAVRALMLPS